MLDTPWIRTVVQNSKILAEDPSVVLPPSKFVIKTFNAISPVGLQQFPNELYDIVPGKDGKPEVAHAILLRSHKLKDEDVPITCRAVARCGAGTNNCNVARMTEVGVPVFNTPGANANAVKELVLASLFLASRGVVEGINHMKKLHLEGTAHERIEKDKAMFGGRELYGKTLGVVGLGAIGAAVCEAALSLGMKVVGYDPALSVEAALRLPGAKDLRICGELRDVCSVADYITIHAPYMKETHHLIGEPEIAQLKKDACILNFARGELVDADALAHKFDAGSTGKYICDFALPPVLLNRANVLSIPHLGASTEEAEENAASMAADTIRDFLETGSIRHSVNFPTCALPRRSDSVTRITVVNDNRPGMLGTIMSLFGDAGINILQQMNTSRGEIAYNVIDVEKPADGDDKEHFTYKNWNELQLALTSLDGVKSTRILFGRNGAGFAVRYKGEVHGIGVDISPTTKTFAE